MCCLPLAAAPTTFSNLYFAELTNNKWKKKKWNGPLQYEDKSGTLMMLSTDMCGGRGGCFFRGVPVGDGGDGGAGGVGDLLISAQILAVAAAPPQGHLCFVSREQGSLCVCRWLLWDKKFKTYVQTYAKDEQKVREGVLCGRAAGRAGC